MKFAAGITLYNPDEARVQHALEYSGSFDLVFLFNNSEPGYKVPLLDNPGVLPENYIILTENENCGLPYAFNRIINDDRCETMDFLCTLDQDSVFEHADISQLKKYIETCGFVDSIGVIAPYVDYGFGSHINSNTAEAKRWVIASGSFINLNVIRKEKMGYDNKYFIDKFEIDLCRQMTTKNYAVLMYHGSVLHQSLGESSGHHHPNHSPLRHYYLFRNRFYFNNKWNYGIKGAALSLAQTIKHEMLIALYENNKIAKMKMLLPAIRDYKNESMGKNTK